MERYTIPADDYYAACLDAGRKGDFDYLTHLINDFEVKPDGLAYPKIHFTRTGQAEYTLTWDVR